MNCTCVLQSCIPEMNMLSGHIPDLKKYIQGSTFRTFRYLLENNL